MKEGGKNGNDGGVINEGGKNGGAINDGGKNGDATKDGGKNGGKNGGVTVDPSYISPKRIHSSSAIFKSVALPYCASIYICAFLLFITTDESGENVVLPVPISIKLN